MNPTFRKLKADEIECRISSINKAYIQLLLYKDARVDQNILDETVGSMNWQRYHSRDNANCIVSIWDDEKSQWIEKEDTGKESYTEAEKGLASDSFKRACFNWGIGRELYTAPQIKFKRSLANVTDDNKCYDKFYVKHITYDESGRIRELTIINNNTGVTVFETSNSQERNDIMDLAEKKQDSSFIDKATEKTIKEELKRTGQDEKAFLEHYKISKWSELKVNQATLLLERLKER